MWKYVATDFEVHRVNHLLYTYYVTKKMFSPRVNNWTCNHSQSI